MSLTEGIYLLRAVTVGHPPGVGGEYATAAGLDCPIGTSAQIPDLVDSQHWLLEPAPGKDLWYIFQSPPPDDQEDVLERPGFHNDSVKPGTPVKLSYTASPYRLSERGKNVYVISPTNVPAGLVGVNHVMGVSEENKVEIQGIPVIQNPPPTPGWELTSVY